MDLKPKQIGVKILLSNRTGIKMWKYNWTFVKWKQDI